MIGCVRFGHNAAHLSETIDHKVIRTMIPHIQQQFLADSLQDVPLLAFKRSLVALGGVKDDASRLRAERSKSSGVSGDQTKRAGLVTDRQPVLDPQSVA